MKLSSDLPPGEAELIIFAAEEGAPLRGKGRIVRLPPEFPEGPAEVIAASSGTSTATTTSSPERSAPSIRRTYASVPNAGTPALDVRAACSFLGGLIQTFSAANLVVCAMRDDPSRDVLLGILRCRAPRCTRRSCCRLAYRVCTSTLAGPRATSSGLRTAKSRHEELGAASDDHSSVWRHRDRPWF